MRYKKRQARFRHLWFSVWTPDAVARGHQGSQMADIPLN